MMTTEQKPAEERSFHPTELAQALKVAAPEWSDAAALHIAGSIWDGLHQSYLAGREKVPDSCRERFDRLIADVEIANREGAEALDDSPEFSGLAEALPRRRRGRLSPTGSGSAELDPALRDRLRGRSAMSTLLVEHRCVSGKTQSGSSTICVKCLGRNNLFDELCLRMADCGVPVHFQPGLARFLIGGIRPGGFLTAVLENDLREAMAQSDGKSRAGLFSIVSFLHNDVPAPSSGSVEKVAAWQAMADEERADVIGACLR